MSAQASSSKASSSEDSHGSHLLRKHNGGSPASEETNITEPDANSIMNIEKTAALHTEALWNAASKENDALSGRSQGRSMRGPAARRKKRIEATHSGSDPSFDSLPNIPHASSYDVKLSSPYDAASKARIPTPPSSPAVPSRSRRRVVSFGDEENRSNITSFRAGVDMYRLPTPSRQPDPIRPLPQSAPPVTRSFSQQQIDSDRDLFLRPLPTPPNSSRRNSLRPAMPSPRMSQVPAMIPPRRMGSSTDSPAASPEMAREKSKELEEMPFLWTHAPPRTASLEGSTSPTLQASQPSSITATLSPLLDVQSPERRPSKLKKKQRQPSYFTAGAVPLMPDLPPTFTSAHPSTSTMSFSAVATSSQGSSPLSLVLNTAEHSPAPSASPGWGIDENEEPLFNYQSPTVSTQQKPPRPTLSVSVPASIPVRPKPTTLQRRSTLKSVGEALGILKRTKSVASGPNSAPPTMAKKLKRRLTSKDKDKLPTIANQDVAFVTDPLNGFQSTRCQPEASTSQPVLPSSIAKELSVEHIPPAPTSPLSPSPIRPPRRRPPTFDWPELQADEPDAESEEQHFASSAQAEGNSVEVHKERGKTLSMLMGIDDDRQFLQAMHHFKDVRPNDTQEQHELDHTQACFIIRELIASEKSYAKHMKDLLSNLNSSMKAPTTMSPSSLALPVFSSMSEGHGMPEEMHRSFSSNSLPSRAISSSPPPMSPILPDNDHAELLRAYLYPLLILSDQLCKRAESDPTPYGVGVAFLGMEDEMRDVFLDWIRVLDDGTAARRVAPAIVIGRNHRRARTSEAEKGSASLKFDRRRSWAATVASKARRQSAQPRPASSRELGTEDVMIMPVQRMSRYPLILRQLLKYTPAESSPYILIERALRITEGIAAACDSWEPNYTKRTESAEM